MTTSALNLGGYGTEDDYEEAVLNSLRLHLNVIVPRLAQSGSPLPAPAELADTMAAAVPGATTRSEYDTLLGPFYSSTGVMRLLDVPSKQALADRRTRGTILAARTSDNMWVYPAFQFDVQAHAVRRSLVPLLAALKTAPRWGAALWLVTDHDELRGRSPLKAAAASDKERDVVTRLAVQYAQAVTA